MDAYDPATVFSSIDESGRYAYGNQPQIAAGEPRPAGRGPAAAVRRQQRRWPLVEAATEVLNGFTRRLRASLGQCAWRRSLGSPRRTGRWRRTPSTLDAVADGRFHAVSSARCPPDTARTLFTEPEPLMPGVARREVLLPADRAAVTAAYDLGQPRLHPARNACAEEALAAATEGEMGPFRPCSRTSFLRPSRSGPAWEDYAGPAPDEPRPVLSPTAAPRARAGALPSTTRSGCGWGRLSWSRRGPATGRRPVTQLPRQPGGG